MNTKGFTLTELIVTIALIGIISIIAFPAISKLKEDNELEKYKTYEKVMENGAKLYVDSYKADLWSIDETSTKPIYYNTLYTNGYIDEYDDDDISCRRSYVCVTKDNSGVSYKTVVICTNSSSKIIYNTNDELQKQGKSPISC